MTDLPFTPANPDAGRFVRTATGWGIEAGPRTDLFTPPDGSAPMANAPMLRLPAGVCPVSLRARVRPAFAATFDAGALMLFTQSGAWAKLAYERSPQGVPTVVTVVTKDTSDDANGEEPGLEALWLRLWTDGRVAACHTSADGGFWKLARLFALPGLAEGATLALLAQSPAGAGCAVAFEHVALDRAPLADLRDGS